MSDQPPRHCTAPGCGKVLVRHRETDARWAGRKFCSRLCRTAANRATRVEASKVCRGCGQVYHRKEGQDLCDFNRRPYCSGECYRSRATTRAYRKPQTSQGSKAFIARGKVAGANAAAARRIAAAPKGRFETVEEAEARGIVISRIVPSYADCLSPAGMPVGSKIGFRTGKVGR